MNIDLMGVEESFTGRAADLGPVYVSDLPHHKKCKK
jgi:hypothetical protein